MAKDGRKMKAKSKACVENRMVREETAGYGGSAIVLYHAPDGQVSLDVRLERDTVWLTQKQMAALFDTERSVITKHLRNVLKEGELDREAVCAKFAHTAEDGKVYQTSFYNLDAIISVGYRVKSTGSQLLHFLQQFRKRALAEALAVLRTSHPK
ncbi:MAG: virulence RhuM family protein [Candidatus Hydrogenedentes bacterium]|nr:virulence RhuM family protein [Candidatus Hydrogenedentota bacterium]